MSKQDVVCERCGRAAWDHEFGEVVPEATPAHLYAFHSGYGCDTGCCGTQMVLLTADCQIVRHEFKFSHDWDDVVAFAEKYGVPVDVHLSEQDAVERCYG